MYHVLHYLRIALSYLNIDKKLSEKEKNEISIKISQLIKDLNENYYNGKFKI